MEFNNEKCQVLVLKRTNHMHQHRLGADWLEGIFAEKALGILMDKKLSTSHLEIFLYYQKEFQTFIH